MSTVWEVEDSADMTGQLRIWTQLNSRSLVNSAQLTVVYNPSTLTEVGTHRLACPPTEWGRVIQLLRLVNIHRLCPTSSVRGMRIVLVCMKVGDSDGACLLYSQLLSAQLCRQVCDVAGERSEPLLLQHTLRLPCPLVQLDAPDVPFTQCGCQDRG